MPPFSAVATPALRGLWTTIALCVAGTVSPVAAADHLNKFWQTSDGMPSNVVSGVARDDEGFLWIGTGAGVARFDGWRFEVHSVEEGLPDSQIQSLHHDGRGRLWAGTRLGAACYKDGEWRVLGQLPEESIFSIGSGADGSVWFGAYRGCWRWHEGRLEAIDFGTVPPDTRAFLPDGDGGMWIATQSQLCRWSPDRPGEARAVPGPWSGRDLRDLGRDARGRLILGGTDVLYRRTEDGWEDLGKTLPGDAGRSILTCTGAPDGSIWVGTRDSGILVRRDGGWTALDSSGDLLSLDDVRALHADDDGLVWAGTNGGGLNLLRRRAFESFSLEEGLGGAVTSALVIGPDGTVYAGSDGGGIFRHEDGRFVPVPGHSAISETQSIWSLSAGPGDALWAGTYRNGLLRIRPGGTSRIPIFDEGPTPTISALFPTADGELLIGLRNLATVRHPSVVRLSRGKPDPAFEGPPQDGLSVRDLIQDENGRIWAACGPDGLWRATAGTWEQLEGLSDTPGLTPAALHEGSHGEIWIGSLDQGLLRYGPEGVDAWSLEDGLASDTVVQILEDRAGDLWIGTDSGLQRLSGESLRSGKTPLHGLRIGREDGLPTPQFSGEHGNLCARAADGSLWFSLASGAIHLDPADFSDAPPPPRPWIESAATDRGMLRDRATGPSGHAPVTVPPGSGTLRLTFSAPEFVTPEKLRFRCRMEGLEEEWRELEGSRSVSYSSLPPGRYRFRLAAAGPGGRWTPPLDDLEILVQPHFWQTTTFRVLGAILLLALIASAARGWTLRRARRKIEALRNERRVENERARIARDLHDELGASLTEINFLGTLVGDSITDPSGRRKVAGIVDRARDMAESLDEIVWTVNPDNDTLAATIYYLCSRVRESLASAGLRHRFEIDEDIPERPLDSRQRHHLLMAVNEAVTNAMRHARAAEVRLRIRLAGDHLRVEIADDGRGFNPGDAPPDRNGLRNMRERMAAVGGGLTISSDAAGTVVTLELRLDHPAPHRRKRRSRAIS